MARRDKCAFGNSWPRLIAAAALSLASYACSDAQILERNSGVSSNSVPRQFGAEEKRAAQSLSLGSERSAMPDATPYQQALQCSFAYPTLAARLTGMGSDPRIGNASKEAKTFFDKRLQQLASQENKSAAQLAADLAAQEALFLDEGAKIRTAVSCLRGLRSS